jgi:predicted metal-dependent phosphoesterase TrpH
MASRVDLHVHSKFSDRPTEWILRRIGSPECYTEPTAIYETAKRRGMQFVTISDHNCIQGALEIACHEDVFIGNEITTYFPEDGCKIHVLTWKISEPQFEEIQQQGVERLIDNPSVRQEMAAYARSYAEKQSWERIYLDFWNG